MTGDLAAGAVFRYRLDGDVYMRSDIDDTRLRLDEAMIDDSDCFGIPVSRAESRSVYDCSFGRHWERVTEK